MLNVICLKWGVKYGPHYVNRLYSGMKRHSTVDFKFHCFTDDASELDPAIIIHDLPYNTLEGWWNKVFLFSNEIDIPQGETIFYIDLDTIITRNIDYILKYRHETITVLRDFYWGLAKTAGVMGSAIMSWEHGKYTYIWNKFIADPNAAMKAVEPHGDQHWVNLCVRNKIFWQDIFVNKIVSFKVHCRSGLPKEATMICYHGVPSIPDSAKYGGKSWKFIYDAQPWVLDYWID